MEAQRPGDLRNWRSFVKIYKKRIIIGALILMVLYCACSVKWRVSIMDGTRAIYISDYREYYFFTRFKSSNWPPPFGAGKHIIFFKPGQKENMLEKIRKDVTGIMETLIEEHRDIFYKYEVSDDFSEVRIYETPGGIGKTGFDALEPEVMGRIHSLMGLYHSFYNGGSATFGEDYVFEIIKPDG